MKTKNLSGLITSLAFATILSGCVYLHMTHLTDDDKEWISPSKVKDKVLFVSESGHTDTIKHLPFNVYERENPFYFKEDSEEYKSTFEAYGWYTFTIYPDEDARDSLGGRFLVKRFSDDTQGFSSVLGMRMSKGYDKVKACDTISQVLLPFLPYDPIPQNYIIFDDSNSDYSDYMSKHMQYKIDTYIINKNYGLVYYKLENGEEFTRKFD